MRAAEQGGAELVLQIADGIGDRRLAHAELPPGQRERAQAAGGLEYDEAGGGGEQAAQGLHKLSLCKAGNFPALLGG